MKILVILYQQNYNPQTNEKGKEWKKGKTPKYYRPGDTVVVHMSHTTMSYSGTMLIFCDQNANFQRYSQIKTVAEQGYILKDIVASILD